MALTESGKDVRNRELAFEQLRQRYGRRVLGTCCRICGQLGEDAAQEAWIRIYKKLSGLKDEEKIEGWIFTIAVNAAKSMLRQSRNVATEYDDNCFCDTCIVETDFWLVLDRFFFDLDDIERTILTLKSQGATDKQIADQLKLSESTVRNRRHEMSERYDRYSAISKAEN